MVMIILIIFLILIIMINSEMSNAIIVKETIGPTNGYMKRVPTDSSTEIELIFAIKQKTDEIEKILIDVSDPKSPKYGQHLTKQEIDAITANHEGHNLVLEYLNKIGASILSSNDNYITTKAKASVWNSALSTIFYEYENINPGSGQLKTVNRCEQYSLPENIVNEVSTVMNTVQFNAPISKGPRIAKIPLTRLEPQISHHRADINNDKNNEK